MKNLFDVERFLKIKTFLVNNIVALLVILEYVCFAHIAFLRISPLSCFRLGLLEEIA